ncbi:MAG: HAMP domain-containing histidine kinase [Clostridia bacterium]|nr:HAMP domain-containing histidine kinase [Clostridia bacterium]
MLKKLKWKIVRMNLTLVSIVLLLAMVIVCGATVNSSVYELYRSLRQEASALYRTSSDPAQLGQTDNPPSHPASVPHLTALLHNDGTWEIEQSPTVSIDQDSLASALALVQHAEDDEGLLMELRMAFIRRHTRDGVLVVLGDSSTVRVTLQNSLLVCAAVFLGGFAVFFAISLVMSNMAVKPIEDAWQKQKQFIADASHELKTPLTVISANNNIIASHPHETVAQQQQWLHSTTEEVSQMRTLIDEMLVLAQAEDAQAAIHLDTINISDLLEEELLFLEPLAYEKNISLECRIEKQVILNTNGPQLKKLAVILVDNAMKHGIPGLPVTFTLTGGSAVTLSVHNHGAIPPEDLPHLFDRFYRSDKSRSTSGYGLGLAIAQAISQQLNGKLAVTSTEAAGTTFTVVFKP